MNSLKISRWISFSLLLVMFQDLISLNSMALARGLEFAGKLLDELIVVIVLSYIVAGLVLRKHVIMNAALNPGLIRYPLIGICFIVIVGFCGNLMQGSELHVALLGMMYFLRPFVVLVAVYIVASIGIEVSRVHSFIIVSFLVLVTFSALDYFFMGAYRSIAHINLAPIIQNWGQVERSGSIRLMANFEHPTLLGWFSAAAFMYFLSRAFVYGLKVRYILCLMVFLLIVIMTGSRKSLVGIALVMLMVVVLHFVIKKYLGGIKYVAIGMLFIVPTLVLNSERFEAHYLGLEKEYLLDTSELTARGALYLTSVSIAKDNFPFGSGFGTYGGGISSTFYSPEYDKYNISTIYGLSRSFPGFISDTYWPHVLGELGVIGALSWFGMVSLVLYFLIKSALYFMRYGSGQYKVLSIFALLIYLESLLELVAAPVFEDPKISLWVFSLAGIVLAEYNKVRNHNK